MASKPAITAKDVSKHFKLPHEKHSGLKQVVLNLGVNKGYEIQNVLHDISFSIQRGDFYAIVGRNGSGKSTLLKLLAGIYHPSSGRIGVHGKLVPFIELGVGFNPELTGRENVFLNAALLGFSQKETEAMYEDIVDFAELQAFMDQKLKNYSSGMQVRLAFSIAIRAQSDILLIDEVLAVGDANFQQKCFDYFEKLKRTGQTVVFVSHDMTAVKRFCTRAIYLKNGKIVQEGSPSDIADLYVQENIERQNDELIEPGTSAYKIGVKIVERANDRLRLELSYKAAAEVPLYIGLSVQKDGISVAEITTRGQHSIAGPRGKIWYDLDTSMFNTGGYQVGAGLFKAENQELVAANEARCNFVLKGNDPNRGGALHLKDAWSLEQE